MKATVPSFYSVLQYVPHPLTDERVNIGVITVERETTAVQLLSDWRRVANFGGVNVDSLSRAVKGVVEDLRAIKSPEQLEELSRAWTHSVQITAPRASLLSAETLLPKMVEMMLIDVAPTTQRRPKLELVRRARSAVEVALREHQVEQHGHVDQRLNVPGLYTSHPVDLAISNGKLLVAAQALSFERSPGAQVQRDISATAFILDDIGRSFSPPSLALLVRPPEEADRADYVSAMNLFQQLPTEIVSPRQMGSWASGVAERVADSASE
jgi:hypothetical protein